MNITIPYNFELRDYQIELFAALDGGLKRALLVWHRRAGKDLTCWNYLIKAAWERPGQYFYCFPQYGQGRKILWEGITNNGRKYLDYIPKEILARVVNQDMVIELTNGSVIRVIGVDNIDTVVGTNPVGIIMSEYSLQDPRGWTYLSPILAANKGWAIFNGTPRGRNHQYDLDVKVTNLDHWYTSHLTVDDTYGDDGLPIVSEKYIDLERDEGKEEDMIQQEYYCSYAAAMKGSFYGDLMQKAKDGGRYGNFPHNDHLWVDCYFDIGRNDSTSIWFRQLNNGRNEFIDYYEDSGKGVAHYVNILKDRGYQYNTFWLPHDGAHMTWQTNKTNREIMIECMESAGLKAIVEVTPKLPVIDGINAVRKKFSTCYFDYNTADGVKMLELYHKRYDEKRRVFMNQPVHDWTSHCADAFRVFGVSDEVLDSKEIGAEFIKVNTDFNALG